jgi:hypothetical protein
VVSVAAVLAFAVVGTAALAAKKANVKLVNKSDWTIEELYLSPADEEEWGPDQLAQHVIKPGAEFTLTGIPCDKWDVKLVDQDGDACVVGDVDICGQNDTWVINSKDLLKCQAASN